MSKANRFKEGQVQAPGAKPRSIFTNSSGQVFPIIGMSAYTLDRIKLDIKARWLAEGRSYPDIDPPPPTYIAENVAGEKIELPMDAEAVETEEEKVKWAEYQLVLSANQAIRDEFQREYNTELSDEILLCVDVEPNEDEDWLEYCEYRRVEIPKNKYARLKLYVQSWVVRTLSDLPALISRVMVTSELAKEEAVATVEAAFRDQLQVAFGGQYPAGATRDEIK